MSILNLDNLRFSGLVGTGGVGWGRFFLMKANPTLGREESRSGRFLDRRDYCKLHILSFYVKNLLGRGFRVIPISRVGEDEAGRRLLKEMKRCGLEMRHVRAVRGGSTLYSFSFLYPDGSGGNLTTDNSACALVDDETIESAAESLAALGERGIAVALPEVPLRARERLLGLAGRHGLFRIASFTSEEIREVRRKKLLTEIELLAVNRDEALGFVEASDRSLPAPELADRMIAGISARFPSLWVSMTAGKEGSWSWDGRSLSHVPAVPVSVITTGGAGDAHLSGIIAGLALGLSLNDSQKLGALMAASSIASPHAINAAISRKILLDLAKTDDAVFRTILQFLQ
jgi:sugar/nucleoside kinase (ribokinase family)